MSDEKTISVDRSVAVFIKIRDKRDALRVTFEREELELEEQLNVIREELLKTCEAIGASSLKTPHGTVIRRVATRYWTGDWSSMHNFIKENDAMELLERRIHQGNLKAFLEENPEKLPPGLNSDSHYEVSIRRK